MNDLVTPERLEKTRQYGAETYEKGYGIYAALCGDCAWRIAYYQARTTYAWDEYVRAFVEGFMEQRTKMPPLDKDQLWFYGTLPERGGGNETPT